VSVKRYPNAAIDLVDGEQVWADVVLAREYDALAARLAEAERVLSDQSPQWVATVEDAKRYRWLRDADASGKILVINDAQILEANILFEDELDAAIDAAMAADSAEVICTCSPQAEGVEWEVFCPTHGVFRSSDAQESPDPALSHLSDRRELP